MKLITRKSEIKIHLKKCIAVYHKGGIDLCVKETEVQLLNYKVKFPLLEYCATEFYTIILEKEQILFCDKIEALKKEGGNVLLGVLLQKRLTNHFKESLQKATEYISKADIWYVCDIIGERVFGFSLLHEPKKTIPEIKKLTTHPSRWVIRSLGAGTHYAIKKGLEKHHVVTMFKLLLTMANTKDKEIRQGVGWAAKTTARFHSTIITEFQKEINDTVNVANWFRTKVKIGLSRNKYYTKKS